MRKIIAATIFAFICLMPFTVFAADAPEPGDYDYGTPDETDYIQSGSVDEKATGDMLDSGTVEAKPTKTPIPTPIPEATAVPTPRPKPTVKKVTPRPTAVPAPTRAPIGFPGLVISKAAIDEIAQKRTANNYFGMLGGERKFTLSLVLENKGSTAAMYTTVELKSGHVSILTNEPEKILGTILPNARLDLVYPVIVLASYDGDLKLPITLKITANGLVKEFPIDVYIDESVPYLLYIGGGLLILLILLILIMALRGGKKGGSKKGKDYDFNL